VRVHCDECGRDFENRYRSTLCPHRAFPANDGRNNFKTHPEAFISGGSGVCPGCGSNNTFVSEAGIPNCHDCGFTP